MIPEPGDPNRKVPLNETFHVQTDDELTEKELKQIEANDQAIQTILLGLPKDIYAAVDSCKTAQEIYASPRSTIIQSELHATTNATTTMNMALALMDKAFKLNYSTPTNNNQRFHQNHIIDRLLNRNVVNLNGYNAVQNVGNQTDKALVYDSDGSAEVHNYEDCYDNEIFNMFTKEEQYTDLLKPIPESHQVPQIDINVISKVTNVEQSGGTVQQHPANVEKTRVLYDSLYHNLAIEVEKVNTVNRNWKETNAELTTELARFKNQEKCFEINQEKYDKLERCYQKFVYQEKCLSKKINALRLRSDKQIMTLNEKISYLNKQLSKGKSTVSFLLEEKKS
nr:hypothetical protein [Tanacetum cinerariifolium]GEW32673.1 hypothetical protein [Tanacetum cinerariifolium]